MTNQNQELEVAEAAVDQAKEDLANHYSRNAIVRARIREWNVLEVAVSDLSLPDLDNPDGWARNLLLNVSAALHTLGEALDRSGRAITDSVEREVLFARRDKALQSRDDVRRFVGTFNP